MRVARDLELLAGVHVSIRPIERSETTRIPADILAKVVSGVQPEPWELLIWSPGFAPTPGKKTAVFTMFEATRLPANAVQMLNLAKVVIVPSQWNADTFSAAGVNVPIRVVPLGVDSSFYSSITRYHGDRVIFGCGGRTDGPGARKSILDVTWAFLKAFPRDQSVRLQFKQSPGCADVEKYGDRRIETATMPLTEKAMALWYGNLTCFVSASRGEGWGLMAHEAMACGVPAMMAPWGGVNEYFKALDGYALPYKLEEANGYYQGCGVWAKPDLDEMVRQMRKVRNDPDGAAQRGRAASSRIRHLTWENSNRKLIEVLEEFGAIPDEVHVVRRSRTYYHSGNLGDIVYALYAIKQAGGGDLLIGPKQNHTSPCQVPTTEAQFKAFLPLLKLQPYLRKVEYRPEYPAGEIDVDLNRFRDTWNNWQVRHRERIDTLCKCHFHTLGIMSRFDEDDAWMRAPLRPTEPIIIHRSLRYRSSDFPWKQLVSAYGHRIRFVGLHEEVDDFINNFGTVVFFHVRDLLQMAEIINGASVCIMNQSFPLSVAIGLRQRVMVEEWPQSPDCRFKRTNYHSGIDWGWLERNIK